MAQAMKCRAVANSTQTPRCEVFGEVCSSGQTYSFSPSRMSHLGNKESNLQMRHKRRRHGSLVGLEQYALDYSCRVVCPLAPRRGHILHTRRIHPHPSAGSSGHLRN